MVPVEVFSSGGSYREESLEGIAVQNYDRKLVDFAPFGTPLGTDEVKSRLSASLYRQLSEDSDDVTVKAINRAQIAAGAILHNVGAQFDLDNKVVREIVLLFVVYELHMALGHEEAGREYRIQAKNIIIAAFGSYPDSDSKQEKGLPVGAVARYAPRPNLAASSDYHRARHLQ